MKTLFSSPRLFLFLAAAVFVGTGVSGCTTTDPSTDTIVYPTPAEKNQRMQEQMSQVTRSFL